MPFFGWFLIVGALLVLMALAGTVVKRIPLSTSVLYLCIGLALGSHGLGLLHIEPVRNARLVERLSEIAVLISLFTAGLKLGAPFSDNRWRLPLRLAFVSMFVSVALTALVAHVVLHLPLGVAVLLGAILAPTDPVLASDVQVAHSGDRDRLRFALTGEAGLNDGTAFPFVMLGLGLLAEHELGAFGLRWFALDLVWASVAGLAIGGLVGTAIGRLVVYVRTAHKEAFGFDEFLTLGLIALSYGIAVLCHAYGFLAVFAAGLALRRIERKHSHGAPIDVRIAAQAGAAEEIATSVAQAPAYMTQAVLGFNEQLERIGELTLVLLVAGMLTIEYLPPEAVWFVPMLLCLIRPLSILSGALGARASSTQKVLMSWFGIRGIGSVYYLMFALNHGLPSEYHRLFIGLTLTTIAVSIVAHGISVTPLMNQYARLNSAKRSSTA